MVLLRVRNTFVNCTKERAIVIGEEKVTQSDGTSDATHVLKTPSTRFFLFVTIKLAVSPDFVSLLSPNKWVFTINHRSRKKNGSKFVNQN